MFPVSTGIVSIGLGLPEHVRDNSFWPKSFTAEFKERRKDDIGSFDLGSPHADALAREVMSKYRDDPFNGSKRRRVLEEGKHAHALELIAAKDAMAKAGLGPRDIDCVIMTSGVPEVISSNPAALLHKELKLKQGIMTLCIESACSGFIMAYQLAAAQIALGQAKRVLLVQSGVYSRLMPYDRPFSTCFGDAATAVIVGPAKEGYGLLGSSWFTFGDFFKAVCITSNGSNWYEGKAPIQVTALDLAAAKPQVPRMGILSGEAVGAALDRARLQKKDVDVFAVHQATGWFGELCQRASGLEHAKLPYTFEDYASTGTPNVPLNLNHGLEQGMIKDGSVVAMYACGAGMTYGSLIVRWGGIA